MSSSRLHCLWRRTLLPWSRSRNTARSRTYSSSGGASGSAVPSRHAQFYSDLVPGMIPVALLGSAVYLGLRLLQQSLAHEKYLEEARARVKELEEEVEALRLAQAAGRADQHGQTSGKSKSRWWF